MACAGTTASLPRHGPTVHDPLEQVKGLWSVWCRDKATVELLAKLDNGSVNVWLKGEDSARGKVLGHGALHSGVRVWVRLAKKGILDLPVDDGAAAVIEFGLLGPESQSASGRLGTAEAAHLGPFSISPVHRLDQIGVVEGQRVWSNSHHWPVLVVELSHSQMIAAAPNDSEAPEVGPSCRVQVLVKRHGDQQRLGERS